MRPSDIASIEEKIDYRFSNVALLEQALTKPSYASVDITTRDYQMLEFIGDTVLNAAAVKMLAEKYCKVDENGQLVSSATEGTLTEKKIEMINNKTLAHCVDMLGLNRYVRKAYGNLSYDVKTKRGDIVESIIGAVAIDSGWNWNVLVSVVDNLLKLRTMQENFMLRLETLCAKKRLGTPLYSRNKNGDLHECYVSIPNCDKVLCGKSENALLAQNLAAEKAYKYVKLLLLREVIDPELVEPVSQLTLLFNQNKISEPVYEFTQVAGTQGNESVWRCEASVEECDEIYCAEGASKQEAKKTAAYSLLCRLLSVEDRQNVRVDDTGVLLQEQDALVSAELHGVAEGGAGMRTAVADAQAGAGLQTGTAAAQAPVSLQTGMAATQAPATLQPRGHGLLHLILSTYRREDSAQEA